VALNLARPEPLETRHPELSKLINFEENGVRRSLQTAARRSDQKSRKRQNSTMR